MGKLKLEDLDRLSAEFTKKKTDLTDEINSLLNRESVLAAEIKAAAESGDVDTYMAKTNEMERVSAAIFVKRAQLDKIKKPFEAADVADAIQAYAKSHNREIAKQIAEFANEQQKLVSMFVELCKKQNAFLKAKEHAVALADDYVDLSGLNIEWIPSETCNIKPSMLPYYAARLRVGRCEDEADAVQLLAFFQSVLNGKVYHEVPRFI